MTHNDDDGSLPSAARAWEILMDAKTRGVVPRGEQSRVAASTEDLDTALLHAATAVNDAVTSGSLKRDRGENAMLCLLIIRDFITPLPDALISDDYLRAGLDSLRLDLDERRR
jgi:hypothetical protein